jgi:hypothetical protein
MTEIHFQEKPGQPTPQTPITPPPPVGPTMPQAGTPYYPPQMPMGMPKFGKIPQRTVCPCCRTEVITETWKEAGTATWLIGIGGCFVVGPFAFLAFCLDDLKDTLHVCPKCRKEIGAKRILS